MKVYWQSSRTLVRALLTAAAAGAALALAAAPVPAQEPLETVTLDEAIDRALLHHPAVVQAEGGIGVAEWGERVAWGNYLPSLSFSTGAAHASADRFDPVRNEFVRGQTSQNISAGLSSSVELYTGGRRGAEMRRARAQSTSAEAVFTEQRFNVALQVQRTFFAVLRAGELARVAEARVERAEQAREAAQRRLDVGSATRSDVLRTELELSEARQALLIAENQRRNATYGLGRLVGADGPVGAALTEPLEPRPLALDEEALVELVLSASPSVRTARAAAETGRANLSVARSQYLPTLRLSSNYNWNNQEFSFDGGRQSWGASLGISYPIFNGFSRELNVDQQNAQLATAEARLRDARAAARADLQQALGELRLAEDRLALTEEAVRLAEEDMRVQSERYRLGASTILDQITSQLNLVQAEMNHVAARYDYQIARAELEALVGREL